MGPLCYLRLRLWKNGVLSALSNPKRLIFTVLFGGMIAVVWTVTLLCSMLMRFTMQPQVSVPEVQVRLGVVAALVLLSAKTVEGGLQGRVFSFAPADYDFLFATPISRRLVVVSRLLADSLAALSSALLLVLAMVTFMPSPTVLPDLSWHSVLLLCLAGWLYILFVLNGSRVVELGLASGHPVLARSRPILQVGAWVAGVPLAAVMAFTIWRGPASAEAALEFLSRPPIGIVFMPALAVANFVTGVPPPVLGSVAATILVLLILALACSVAVCLLDRDVVEATLEYSARKWRIRAAAQAQNWERIVGELAQRRRKSSRSLLVRWRTPDLAPLYKFVAEISRQERLSWLGWLVLIMVPGVAVHFLHVEDAWLRIGLPPATAYMVLAVSGTKSLLQIRAELSHLPLLRSLPQTPWRQLLSMTIPRALSQSLAFAGGVLALYIGHPIARADTYVATCMCLPLAILAISLVCAITACIFPNSADPLQRFLGGLVYTVGQGIALGPTIVVFTLGMLLKLPGLLIGLLGNLALIPVVILCTLIAARFYERLEPEEEH